MRFQDQPIARKALTLGLVPAVCALILVVAALGTAAFLSLRRNLVQDATSLVAIVADNMSAAIAFDDPATASQLLRALRANADVDRACVFDATGRLFASYAVGPACVAGDLDGTGALSGELSFIHPIAVGDRRKGSVTLVVNTRLLTSRAEVLGAVALIALLGAAALAWALARRMQQSIALPIIGLSHLADTVSSTRDYSLRAERTTGDEVGRLVDAFNSMLAQIQQQDRVKDDFLAVLSHELRTPLNAMLGWLQILQKTSPGPQQLERALASLERNARAQQRVVEDLLDTSRVITGKLQMASDVVDLRTVLAGAIEVVSTAAAQKSLALRSSMPSEECLVSGDLGRLQQAVWNLLSNGVKFTPPGGSIDATLVEDGSSYVLTVRDTGEGIDPAFLPKVFERFQQADSSTTRETGGLGLGLALVKEIVTLHGGTAVAFSEGRNRGATFVITLPQLLQVPGHQGRSHVSSSV